MNGQENAEKEIGNIEDMAGRCSLGTHLTVAAFCQMARALSRIATQLEKITSLKYTEDA